MRMPLVARTFLSSIALAAVAVLPTSGALNAQPAVKPVAPVKAEGCPKLLAHMPGRIIPAAVQKDHMSLTFIGHSTFLMQTPSGLKVATDYNDSVRPDQPPDVITMNRAHITHYTPNPPKSIKHVLRGWNPQGGAAEHDVTVKDMRIRNVVTNLRGWDGGTDYRGNSMFVFEASLLCVAHLGHLHHELENEHYKQLGRIDVALVPVDGSYTLSREAMLRVVRRMGVSIVVPMHYFGSWSLEEFISLAKSKKFDVKFSKSPTIMLSRKMLPKKPTVVVLPGY